MTTIESLKKTQLFRTLSEIELKALSQASSLQHLKKGQILFNAGDEAKGLYVIVKGTMKAYRENTEGREQVIHVEKAGTTIAEVPVFDDEPYPSTVMAEENSEVLFITKNDVKRLCLKFPTIALAALRLFAVRLRKTAELVESLSLKEVDQRLAIYLLREFKERRSKKLIPPTNSVLAAQLGTVREVVSRAFLKLENKGFIKVHDRRNIELLDEESLKNYAER